MSELLGPDLPVLPRAPGTLTRSAAKSAPAAEAWEGSSFVELLGEALEQVDGLERAADARSVALAKGETRDIHSVAIAVTKADVALRLLVQVRDRAIAAYQEVARMAG